MALYEDFELDITVNNTLDESMRGFTGNCDTTDCYTKCDTCGDCSVSCYGMSNRPCDR